MRTTDPFDARLAKTTSAASVGADASLLSKSLNVARRAGKAAVLLGDVAFIYEGTKVVAEGTPGLVAGAKAVLTGGKDVTPEEAQRIRADTAKTAKEGSSLLTLGFAEIDLADRDATNRSAVKIGVPDWLGVSGSQTGNFVRANVGPGLKVTLEENNLPKPAQFAQGAKVLLESDNAAKKAVGVAVAPAAIVAKATTIPPSQFASGAQVLGGAAYEKTGLGNVGSFLTGKGLNPFAAPAPPPPAPVTPVFASQDKNDRDYAIHLAKRGEALPSNLKKYEAEVASYRPAPPPAPVKLGPPRPPPTPSSPAPLTEAQKRILSGTEPRPPTLAAPQPILGPNNSAAAPKGPAPLTPEQRKAISSMPPPTPPPPPAPPAKPQTPPRAPPNLTRAEKRFLAF